MSYEYQFEKLSFLPLRKVLNVNVGWVGMVAQQVTFMESMISYDVNTWVLTFMESMVSHNV